MTERLRVNGNGNGNGHESGVLIVNPKDQVQVTQALREQVRRATDWEFAPVCDELNTWSDRIQSRFYDPILYPDRPRLQPTIIGIKPLRHDSYLASYSLGRNQFGLRYETDFNQRHFKAVEDGQVESRRMEWVYGGMWGLLESLAHEIGHHWQQEGGGREPYKIGARETHNKEFRDKMESIGIHCNAEGVHTAPADGDFAKLMREYGISRPEIPQQEEGMSFEDWMKFFAEFFKDYKPKGRSTLALWTCDCEPPQRARVGKEVFLAECPVCRSSFKRRS